MFLGLLFAASMALVLGLIGWTAYELLSGNAYRLMRTLRGDRKVGMGLGGGLVPHADASGLIAIAHVGYGMAQWLLILGAVCVLVLLLSQA